MPQVVKRDAGTHCETEKCKYVLRMFQAVDVPPEKLAVCSEPEPAREHRYCVTVQEGRGADMTPDEFGRYVTVGNRLAAEDRATRYATAEEKVLIIGNAHIKRKMDSDISPEEAGRKLLNPKTMSDENRPSNDESSRETDYSGYDVTHVGGDLFAVSDPNDLAWRVHVGATEGERVSPLIGENETVSSETKHRLLTAAIRAGPEYREGPQEALTIDLDVSGSGNGGGGQSDDSGGDIDPGEVVSDPGSTDYDGDELESNVDQWLSNHAELSDPMIDGAWSVEFAEITDPRDGESELGVHISTDPWHGPLWDHDAGQFDTDDGTQPEEWADHKQAVSEIFKSDSKPVKGVPVDNEDTGYTDWYNYVPADEAAEMGS